MTYTIKQLAKIAGVSVRTLHYYDQIGLLKPSFTSENGYRHYGDYELLKLQQILFFRELNFPLKDIGKILNDPSFELSQALDDQKEMLLLEKKRIEKLIETINVTKKELSPIRTAGYIGFRKERKMKDEELYDSFGDEEMKEYQREAKERWGNTEAYKQSMMRVAHMSKEEMQKIQDENERINRELVANMDKGVESAEVQGLIALHRGQINKFYDCGLEIYRGLAEMYVADPRFAKHYNKYHPKLADFLSKAMIYYCEHNEK